jgi:hypothetical protein
VNEKKVGWGGVALAGALFLLSFLGLAIVAKNEYEKTIAVQDKKAAEAVKPPPTPCLAVFHPAEGPVYVSGYAFVDDFGTLFIGASLQLMLNIRADRSIVGPGVMVIPSGQWAAVFSLDPRACGPGLPPIDDADKTAREVTF